MASWIELLWSVWLAVAEMSVGCDEKLLCWRP